jgi:predicted anti-sigma-YlaC factor YlaD
MLLTSCKKATELMELKEERQLGRFELLRLSLHTMMCSACRNYEKQRETIVRAIAAQSDAPMTAEEMEVVKTRIKGALKEG